MSNLATTNPIAKQALTKNIAEKYSLELLLLFGSRAEGTENPKSDFDVAYLSQKDLDLEKESRLIIELAPVFKSENIDLVNIKNASPLLFFAIFQKCRILYEKDSSVFPRLRAYSFKKYVETKPLYAEKFRRLKLKQGINLN